MAKQPQSLLPCCCLTLGPHSNSNTDPKELVSQAEGATGHIIPCCIRSRAAKSWIGSNPPQWFQPLGGFQKVGQDILLYDSRYMYIGKKILYTLKVQLQALYGPKVGGCWFQGLNSNWAPLVALLGTPCCSTGHPLLLYWAPLVALLGTLCCSTGHPLLLYWAPLVALLGTSLGTSCCSTGHLLFPDSIHTGELCELRVNLVHPLSPPTTPLVAGKHLLWVYTHTYTHTHTVYTVHIRLHTTSITHVYSVHCTHTLIHNTYIHTCVYSVHCTHVYTQHKHVYNVHTHTQHTHT